MLRRWLRMAQQVELRWTRVLMGEGMRGRRSELRVRSKMWRVELRTLNVEGGARDHRLCVFASVCLCGYIMRE